MALSHYPPKSPSPQYLEDRVWLKAFVGCGWEGKRALAHADKAVAVWYGCVPVFEDGEKRKFKQR